MSNLQIFIKISGRYFWSFFVLFFVTISIFNFVGNYFEFFKIDESVKETLTRAFFVSLFMVILYSFALYRKFNMKENTSKGAFQIQRIKLNKQRSEMINLLKQVLHNAYFIEGDNFIKIFSLKSSGLTGSFIFITFEEDELFITSRNLDFSAIENSESAKNINLIHALAD
jgi:hypothetical protein